MSCYQGLPSRLRKVWSVRVFLVGLEKKVKVHIIGNFFVSDSGCGLDYVYLHYNKMVAFLRGLKHRNLKIKRKEILIYNHVYILGWRVLLPKDLKFKIFSLPYIVPYCKLMGKLMGIVPYCKSMGNVNDQMLPLLTVLKK